MTMIIVAIGLGFVVGLSDILGERILKFNGKFQNVCLMLLILFMGIGIGGNPEVTGALATLGGKALVYAVLSVIGAVGFVYAITKVFFQKELK